MTPPAEHTRLIQLADELLQLNPESILMDGRFKGVETGPSIHAIEVIRRLAHHLKHITPGLCPPQLARDVMLILTAIKEIWVEITNYGPSTLGGPSSFVSSTYNRLDDKATQLLRVGAPLTCVLMLEEAAPLASLRELPEVQAKSKTLLAEVEQQSARALKEAEATAEKARQLFGAVAVDGFRQTFASEAREQGKTARLWLISVFALSLATLALIAVYYFDPPIDPAFGNPTAYTIGLRIAACALLSGSTAWCAKQYRVHQHQKSLYRFKALALQTFQLFVEQSKSPESREAVLRETTRCIFTGISTGYVPESSSGETQIVEVLNKIPGGFGKATGD